MADHTQLNTLLQGANPEQAAAVVARAIKSVQASTLAPPAKVQATALIHSRALLLSGENAPKMVGALAGQVDKSLLPVIAAATAISVGTTEGPVITAITQAAGTGTETAAGVAAAVVDPTTVLSPDSVTLVQAQAIEMRGVAAAVVPPPGASPANLIPPVVPPPTVYPGQ